MVFLIEKGMSNAIRESKIHSSFKGPWEVTHSKVLLTAQILNSDHLSQDFCPVKSWEKFPGLNYLMVIFFFPLTYSPISPCYF